MYTFCIRLTCNIDVGICETGWTEFQYECYKYFESPTLPISQSEAEQMCKSSGGSLATIKNLLTQATIDNLRNFSLINNNETKIKIDIYCN